MVSLYKDPNGEKIFSKKSEVSNSMVNNTKTGAHFSGTIGDVEVVTLHMKIKELEGELDIAKVNYVAV